MEPNEASHVADAGRASKFPPLRLHHLLLWMTVTAICMLLNRETFQTIDNYAAVFGRQARMTTEAICAILVVASEITICIIGMISRFRGIHFHFQPGHWIAMFTAALAVEGTVVFELFGQENLRGHLLMVGVGSAIWAYIFLAIATRSRDTTSWKSVYVLFGFALSSAAIDAILVSFFSENRSTQVIARINAGLGLCAGVLLLMSTLVAMATDRLFSIRRDWAHWVAILLPLGFGAVLVVWAITDALLAKI
jgi:hypothetical protein